MELAAFGHELNTEIGHAQLILTSAMKQVCRSIQPTVDATTAKLHEYLKPDIDDALILNEQSVRVNKVEITENNRFFVALLIPAIKLKANDIAPTYDIQLDITWHLCLNWPFSTGERLMSMLITPELNNKLGGLMQTCGLKIVNWSPRGLRERLVLDLLKEHKMVERFTTIPAIIVASRD
jgi:hypothetical protein